MGARGKKGRAGARGAAPADAPAAPAPPARSPSPSPTPRPHGAPPPPLRLGADRCVRAPGGAAFLEGVHPAAEPSPASEHLVLGLRWEGGPVSMADALLGRVRCRRWLACARKKLWWMTPAWGGASVAELPPETQFLLLELAEGGPYAIVLPLIDRGRFRGTLRAPRPGSPEAAANALVLRMESGDDAVLGDAWRDAVLLAAGPDPFALVDAAVAEAARLSGGARPLAAKRLPAAIDVFGWCSWDSFYSAVSAAGLSDAVASLAAGGAPPRWVVIDDGWQSTDLDAEFRSWEDVRLPGLEWPPLLAPQSAADKAARGAGGSADGAPPGPDRSRETYIEGEIDALSRLARGIPTGTAAGQIMEEIAAAGGAKAAAALESDDEYAAGGGLPPADARALARQHEAWGGGAAGGPAAPPGAPPPPAGAAPPRARGLARWVHPRRRRHRSLVFALTTGAARYSVGLLVGALQALVLLFYQWVVDPAPDGSWPVALFARAARGPLRRPLLQFFADSTNFTRRLVSVRANAKFCSPDARPEDATSARPEDLKAVIAHLRDALGVRYVYCWHGLSAYWSGIAPDAPAMAKYAARVVFSRPTPGLREVEPSLLWNPSALGGIGAVDDPAPLFRDMHAYLSAAGVTGVKVDCQAGVGLAGSTAGGGPSVAAAYHAALEDSVAEHFPGNDAINCMCHSTENIYRWRDTAVARASDDFYPSDAASHVPHLAACAYNALFLAPLALPDWDMFQTRHAAAHAHAAARAVSGAPVYVSDPPGAHGFDLLRQLVLPDGSVLRAAGPGRPTRDALFADVQRDGVSAAKVWNVNAHGGVVGVFNLQGSAWCRRRRRFFVHDAAPRRVVATVRVADVEPFRGAALGPAAGGGAGAPGRGAAASPDGVAGGGGGAESDGTDASDEPAGGAAAQGAPPLPDWAVYVNATGALHRVPPSGGVAVGVDAAAAAVVTLAPIARRGGVDFAPLGLKNMLNTGGAVAGVAFGLGGPGAPLAALPPLADALAGAADGAAVAAALACDAADGGAPPAAAAVRYRLRVRGRGTLLAYASRPPRRAAVGGAAVAFHLGDGGALTVDVPLVGAAVEQDVDIEF